MIFFFFLGGGGEHVAGFVAERCRFWILGVWELRVEDFEVPPQKLATMLIVRSYS